MERGTFNPASAGKAGVRDAPDPDHRAGPAPAPHPPPRSPPGHSGSGTTFSAAPPPPSTHRTGRRRQRRARSAAPDSKPGCSAGRVPPAHDRRRPGHRPQQAAPRSGPGRAAPGENGPGRRGRNGERQIDPPGRSAGGGPDRDAAHLPPSPPATAPPPLPLLRTLGQRARAQAQVQARLGLWSSGFRGSWLREWPRGLQSLFAPNGV